MVVTLGGYLGSVVAARTKGPDQHDLALALSFLHVHNMAADNGLGAKVQDLR